jgi:hypothetical protein
MIPKKREISGTGVLYIVVVDQIGLTGDRPDACHAVFVV